MAESKTKKSGATKGSTKASEGKSRGSMPAPEPKKAPVPEKPSMNYMMPAVLAVLVVASGGYWLKVSSGAPPEPTPTSGAEPSTPREGSGQAPASEGTVLANPEPAPPGSGQPLQVVQPEPTAPDPRGGRFSLADATAGMPEGTSLKADIETNYGTYVCTLDAEHAPNTVANFVGLARGVRDFWDPSQGAWVRRPYYNGTIFHRVIPDFMVQGGDILRNGRGGPGYEIRDENVTAHNRAGMLCMANHGPNTNGSQFFILESPKDHLNGSYSVFGQCSPNELTRRIARVRANAENRPDAPVLIRAVRIRR